MQVSVKRFNKIIFLQSDEKFFIAFLFLRKFSRITTKKMKHGII